MKLSEEIFAAQFQLKDTTKAPLALPCNANFVNNYIAGIHIFIIL